MIKNFFKLTIFATLFAFFTGCTSDNVKPETPSDKGFTLTANMPESDRISLEKTGKNLTLKWETGDQIQLCYEQGTTKVAQTVTTGAISNNGKTAEFTITPPAGINASQPFNLYGVYGNCTMDEKNPCIIRWSAGTKNTLAGIQNGKNTILTFKLENVSPEGMVNFNHIGSFFCVLVKNTSTKDLTASGVKLYGKGAGTSEGWIYDNNATSAGGYDIKGNKIVMPDDVETGKLINMNSGEAKTYAPGEIMEYWTWRCANSNVKPDLYMQLCNGTNVIQRSAVPKNARPETTAAGKLYYVYSTYDGKAFHFTDHTFTEPYKITFTTEKAIGEQVDLAIDAVEADKKYVWIDLNNNGIKDSDETITKFGVVSHYTLGSQSVTVYGTVADFNCASNKITVLDVTNNTALIKLNCYYNRLTSLDVSRNAALTILNCYNNQLVSLDISQNTALDSLDCSVNQLTSLDVSNNTAMTHLMCYENKFTSLDVSKNTALTYLSCIESQLVSLNVTGATALVWLYCYDNKLTSLDVTGATALVGLMCWNNQIAGSNMTNLVKSLPTCPSTYKGRFFVTKDPWGVSHSGNIITTDDTAIATNKNWDVY